MGSVTGLGACRSFHPAKKIEWNSTSTTNNKVRDVFQVSRETKSNVVLEFFKNLFRFLMSLRGESQPNFKTLIQDSQKIIRKGSASSQDFQEFVEKNDLLKVFSEMKDFEYISSKKDLDALEKSLEDLVSGPSSILEVLKKRRKSAENEVEKRKEFLRLLPLLFEGKTDLVLENLLGCSVREFLDLKKGISDFDENFSFLKTFATSESHTRNYWSLQLELTEKEGLLGGLDKNLREVLSQIGAIRKSMTDVESRLKGSKRFYDLSAAAVKEREKEYQEMVSMSKELDSLNAEIGRLKGLIQNDEKILAPLLLESEELEKQICLQDQMLTNSSLAKNPRKERLLELSQESYRLDKKITILDLEKNSKEERLLALSEEIGDKNESITLSELNSAFAHMNSLKQAIEALLQESNGLQVDLEMKQARQKELRELPETVKYLKFMTQLLFKMEM